LINRTVVHPSRQSLEDGDDADDEDKDFRQNYVFDAYLLGFCDDITRALAKKLFSEEGGDADADDSGADESAKDGGKLLACLKDDDEHYDKDDWAGARDIPGERVFLFPGAQAPARDNIGVAGGGNDDDDTELTYREIAHCDGCAQRIAGRIQKCVTCFDYDLCQGCFPSLSKTHYGGRHRFATEDAVLPFVES